MRIIIDNDGEAAPFLLPEEIKKGDILCINPHTGYVEKTTKNISDGDAFIAGEDVTTRYCYIQANTHLIYNAGDVDPATKFYNNSIGTDFIYGLGDEDE